MLPTAVRIFKIGVVLSILLGFASVVAAVWAAQFELGFDEGIPIGNKELIGYREGLDFRVAMVHGPPIYVRWSGVPTEQQIAAVDAAWGRPNHWMQFPEFSQSLSWPLALSTVLPSIWLLRRRRRATVGFPIAEEE